MSKLSKTDKAEAIAMFEEIRKIFLPPQPKKITVGDLTEKFFDIPNAYELIDAFEKKRLDREEFCGKFGTKKWVYDYLEKMSDFGYAKKHLEKKLSCLKVKESSKKLCSVDGRPLRRDDFDEPTMIVVVNKWDPKNPSGRSLYDAARGYWRVGASGKAYKCRYVVASYFGRVMEVYEIDRNKSWQTWQYSTRKPEQNEVPSPMRRAFEGSVASDAIRAKYLGRSTAGLIRPRVEKVYVGF